MAYPLRLKQDPDGTLTSELPDSYKAKQKTPVVPEPQVGLWRQSTAGMWQSEDSVFSSLRVKNEVRCFDLSLSVTAGPELRAAGVGLYKTSESVGYEVVLDFQRQEIALRSDFASLATQPAQLRRNTPISLRVMVDESVVEVFAGDRHSLVGRVYQQADKPLVLFGERGQVTFSDISLEARRG